MIDPTDMTSTLKGLLVALFISFFFSANTSAQTQNIRTIAGNGTNSYCGDWLPGDQACVQAYDVAITNGYLLISGGNAIRLVTYANIIIEFAGGTTGVGGDGGNMAAADMLDVRGMCVSPVNADIYVCDGNRVRKITATTNVITTVAGGLTPGYGGDNGPATSALLNAPTDVTMDGAGNLYIADKNNNRIRKVSPAGIITTIAGNGIAGYTDGIGGMVNGPQSLTCDASGNVIIADQNNNRIRKMTPTGFLSTIVNVLGIPSYSGDAGLAELAQCSQPKGVAIDPAGNIYFSADNRVRVIRPNGKVYTIAGSGIAGFSGDYGIATNANLNGPLGITTGLDNNMLYNNHLFIADFNNYRARRVDGCGFAPLPVTNVSGPSVVCPGGTYTYSVTPAPYAVYYEWSIPPGWVINGSAVGNSISVTAATNSGVVTTKAVNMCGESVATGPVTVSTVGEGSPISPAGPYVTMCPDINGNGGSITLSVNIPPNQSIMWYMDSNPLPWATSSTYTTTMTGTYHAVMTHNTLGCSASTDSVIVENLYVAAAASAYSACQGDSIALEAYAFSQAPTSLQWQLNGVNIPGVTNDTIYVTQSGNYTVVATANCSSTSPPVQLSFIDTPSLSITPSGPFTICFGTTTQIQANTTEPTYEWRFNGLAVGNANTYFAGQQGNYTITVGGSTVCTSTRSFTVAVDTPQATIIATGPTDLCAGSTVQLNANTGMGFTYQWRKNGVNIPGATGVSYSALSSGIYTSIVDEGLCSDTSASIVVMIDTPQAIITSGGATTICEGQDVQLQANTGTGFMYQWMHNGIILSGSTLSSYTADETGVFAVIVDEGLCSDTADIAITVNPLPIVAIIQNGLDLSVPSGFVSYQWYLNGSPIAGATSENYTATQDGDYYVVVSDGCDGQSNTVTISGTSVADVNVRNGVTVRPNPFTDKAVVSFNNSLHEQHTFSLYDLKGALVQDVQQTSAGEVTIHRGILPAGVYYFRLLKEGSLRGHGKLIIQ